MTPVSAPHRWRQRFGRPPRPSASPGGQHAAAPHALTLATEAGIRDQQARAHTGLEHAHRARRDPGRAREHYEHALVLYRDLGVPDADEILDHLDALARRPGAGVEATGGPATSRCC
jgi:hypothetical protein